jgi:hypothetical protein
MNAEKKAAKARIKDAVRVWAELVPPGVDVRHVFIDSTTDTESPDVVAETKTSWEYHEATIRWSLPNAAALDQDTIDAYLVHELVHVMLAPIELLHRGDDNNLNALCEHTVETVARAIIRLVP